LGAAAPVGVAKLGPLVPLGPPTAAWVDRRVCVGLVEVPKATLSVEQRRAAWRVLGGEIVAGMFVLCYRMHTFRIVVEFRWLGTSLCMRN